MCAGSQGVYRIAGVPLGGILSHITTCVFSCWGLKAASCPTKQFQCREQELYFDHYICVIYSVHSILWNRSDASVISRLSVDQSHFPCDPELLMGTTVQDCLIFPGCRVNQQQIESFTWPSWQRWISGKIGSMKKVIPTSDIEILAPDISRTFLSLGNISFRCFIS